MWQGPRVLLCFPAIRVLVTISQRDSGRTHVATQRAIIEGRRKLVRQTRIEGERGEQESSAAAVAISKSV